MMTDNTNTFPIYKTDVLVQFIRTEILTGQEAKNFTKSDLTPLPKADAIQRVYMRVLQLVFRNRPESLYVVPLSENVQHPQLFEGFAPINKLFLRMRHFLLMCHVYDFSLDDLVAPKLKPTVTILSGIVNFLHFRKQRLDVTLAYQQSFRDNLDRLKACKQGIKDAERRIKELTTIPPEQQAEARELDKVLAELQDNTAQAYQEVNALKTEVADGKNEIIQRTQKLSQLKMDVNGQKEAISKLKSQIVESPEDLNNEMMKMRESIKNMKSIKEEKEERFVENQEVLQAVDCQKVEVQLLNKLLQDLQMGMAKAQQQQEEFQTVLRSDEQLGKELKAVGAEEVQLKRVLALKQDKMSKQNIRRQKRNEVKDHHMRNIVGEYDRVHLKREEVVGEIEKLTKEMQQFKAKIQSMRDISDQETQKAQDMYDHLRSSLDQFHKRLENPLNAEQE